jgi:hypothetical protein
MSKKMARLTRETKSTKERKVNKMDYIAIYNKVKRWYLEGLITDTQWERFCMKCNEQLMIENKDVLLRLKQ